MPALYVVARWATRPQSPGAQPYNGPATVLNARAIHSVASQFNSTLPNTHQSHGSTRSGNSYQHRVSSEHAGYLRQDCDYLQHRRLDANLAPDAFAPTYNGRRDTDDVRTVRDQANVGRNRSRVNYLTNASGAKARSRARVSSSV